MKDVWRKTNFFESINVKNESLAFNWSLNLESTSNLIKVGWFNPALAKSSSDFGNVAENNEVCRFSGNRFKTSINCSSNPISNSLKIKSFKTGFLRESTWSWTSEKNGFPIWYWGSIEAHGDMCTPWFVWLNIAPIWVKARLRPKIPLLGDLM